jgi:hypothetical protein
MALTVDIHIHDSPIVLVVRANSFTIIAVPKANPTTFASREKKVSIFIVFDTGQRTIVAFQQNWTHSQTHVARKMQIPFFGNP